MSTEFVFQLASQAVYTILMSSGPLLLVALVTGLAISIFQATTQIQEQTLSFVPKIVLVFLSLLVFGPWILNTVVDFTYAIFSNLHYYIG